MGYVGYVVPDPGYPSGDFQETHSQVGMPNTFAYFALFGWPVVVMILFRRLPKEQALAWSVIAGYLLLPERTGFDFPLLPVIDKTLIPSLFAGLMLLSTSHVPSRHRIGGAPESAFVVRRGTLLFWGITAMVIGATFITVAQNSDPVMAGPRVLSALRTYDAFSMSLSLGVALLPFLLGRRYLATEKAHVQLLAVMVAAALLYTIPILYELRMSPQVNRIVYGFFPHSFAQHIRGNGYRPLVFLNHGLWLAIFMSMAGLAAVALYRSSRVGEVTDRRWMLKWAFLLLVLVASKSLGALLIAFMLLPLIYGLSKRSQLILAGLIAASILVYPFLRAGGLVPIDRMHSAISTISEERADSFAFRLRNEDILLARANEKPLAGWGGWGRSRIYNYRGEDVSVTDGYWVIAIGDTGWLGYIGRFGLLCMPLILLAWRRKQLEIGHATAGLGLVMAAGLVDLIPNATITPVTWLIAGALMGRYQTAEPISVEASDPSAQRSGHSRAPTAPVAAKAASESAEPTVHVRRPRAGHLA